MNKKLMLLSCLFAFIAGAVIFSSCKKNKDDVQNTAATTLDTETQSSATDNAQAEKTFSDVFDATDDAVSNHPSFDKRGRFRILLSDCANVSVDPGTDSTKFPRYLTISFGNGTSSDSCLGKDGRYRKGKIHIKVENARYREKGSKVTITLDNYYVDGYHVEGTKTIVNNGVNTNASGIYIEYGITVTGGKITTPDGKKSATWGSNRTRQSYIDSLGTLQYCLITGTADGVNYKGNSYTVKITRALKVVPGCRWIEEGTFDLTPNGKLTRTIDYGNGACDRLATITINGKTYQFELR